MRRRETHINRELRWEVLVELGDIEIWYGSLERSSDLLAELQALARQYALGACPNRRDTCAQFALAIAVNRRAAAFSTESQLRSPAARRLTRHESSRLHAHLLVAERVVRERSVPSWRHRAGSQPGRRPLDELRLALAALGATRSNCGGSLGAQITTRWPAVSMAAELVAPDSANWRSEELAKVEAEARLRPARWSDALRAVVDARRPAHVSAAQMLELIGAPRTLPGYASSPRSHRGRPEFQLGRPPRSSSCVPRRCRRPRSSDHPRRITINRGVLDSAEGSRPSLLPVVETKVLGSAR